LGLVVILAMGFGGAVAQAWAGSDLRVVSSFVGVGETVPEDCREQVGLVTQVMAGYLLPGGWHWVVVCDAAAWQRFLRLSGRPGRGDIRASTDLEGHTTYLRGDTLLHRGDFGAGAEEVIGHELAHIRLGSGDEGSAEELSRSWRKALRGGNAGAE